MDGDLVGAQVEPDRKQPISAVAHLKRCERLEFSPRPVFLEEGWTEDDNAEPGSGKAIVDPFDEAVPDLQLPVVVPDSDAAGGAERLRQRAHKPVFVLTRMRDEDVVGIGRRHPRRVYGFRAPRTRAVEAPERPGRASAS